MICSFIEQDYWKARAFKCNHESKNAQSNNIFLIVFEEWGQALCLVSILFMLFLNRTLFCSALCCLEVIFQTEIYWPMAKLRIIFSLMPLPKSHGICYFLCCATTIETAFTSDFSIYVCMIFRLVRNTEKYMLDKDCDYNFMRYIISGLHKNVIISNCFRSPSGISK